MNGTFSRHQRDSAVQARLEAAEAEIEEKVGRPPNLYRGNVWLFLRKPPALGKARTF